MPAESAAMTRAAGRQRRRFACLTLVEVAVVLAVCGVLASLILTATFWARDRARAVDCAQNLKGLGQSYETYLQQNNGGLSEAFYSFAGGWGIYLVYLKTLGEEEPDRLLKLSNAHKLTCPNDRAPTPVLGCDDEGDPEVTPTGYAYNVSLPLLFRNMSRVNEPVNTPTFYDGCALALVGAWAPASAKWAEKSVRARHQETANYLFLDGHVEPLPVFPSARFLNGAPWADSGMFFDVKYGTKENLTPRGPCNINPKSRTGGVVFKMTTTSGVVVTREDLLREEPISGEGFEEDVLEYTGGATEIWLRPEGNADQNGMIINNGQWIHLDNGKVYHITAEIMAVHLYQSSKDGKRMGDWWIAIVARNANIALVSESTPLPG